MGVNLGVGDVPAGCYQAVNSLCLETCVAWLVIFIVTEPGFQNTAATKPRRTRLKATTQNVGEDVRVYELFLQLHPGLDHPDGIHQGVCNEG